MKFSVIIPTYNRAEYVLEAIDSALLQTYSDFEVIIVDDGSKDDTGALIQTHYNNNNKIKYYYKQNEERGAARNYGMSKATGDYAVFFDSDDWMKPSYLQTLQEVILSMDVKPFMVAAKYTFKDDETGKEWNSSMQEVPEGWYDINAFLKGNMLACNFCVQLQNPDLQPFPSDRTLASMEDWLFLLQNLREQRLYIIDKVGVIMREHPGRSMANNQKIILAREKATEWALKHLSLNQDQQQTLEIFSSYFCGIHEYLDGNTSSALSQSIQAIRSGGMQPLFLRLFIKSLVGKKTIDRFKKYAG